MGLRIVFATSFEVQGAPVLSLLNAENKFAPCWVPELGFKWCARGLPKSNFWKYYRFSRWLCWWFSCHEVLSLLPLPFYPTAFSKAVEQIFCKRLFQFCITACEGGTASCLQSNMEHFSSQLLLWVELRPPMSCFLTN